jgi:hypothetical protein
MRVLCQGSSSSAWVVSTPNAGISSDSIVIDVWAGRPKFDSRQG